VQSRRRARTSPESPAVFKQDERETMYEYINGTALLLVMMLAWAIYKATFSDRKDG